MKDFRGQLRLVRRAPEVCLPVPGRLSFEALATYVEGMNAGSNGALLDGFREYLMLRLGVLDRRPWPALLQRLRFGDAPAPVEEDDLVAFTFGVLDEFLAEPDRGAIHREYLLWQQHQPGYDPARLRFGDTPRAQLLSVAQAAQQLRTDRGGVFDLIAAGRLTPLRDGPELLFHPFNVQRLATALGLGPDRSQPASG